MNEKIGRGRRMIGKGEDRERLQDRKAMGDRENIS